MAAITPVQTLLAVLISQKAPRQSILVESSQRKQSQVDISPVTASDRRRQTLKQDKKHFRFPCAKILRFNTKFILKYFRKQLQYERLLACLIDESNDLPI